MDKRVTISTLNKMKSEREKFVMMTAYDSTFARLISEAGAETILVGDSLGMVLQGHDNTIPVGIDDMVYHTACVCRGRPHSLVVADLPFMSYDTTEKALQSGMLLMQAGAQMVKMEGGVWLSDSIHQLVERGIPVCAHLGLTPQSVNVFGGYRVRAGRRKKPNLSSRMRLKFKMLAPACWCSNAFRPTSPLTSAPNSIFLLLALVLALARTPKYWCCTTCSASPKTRPSL